MLTVRDLVIKFRAFEAVKSISFQVDPGEIFGFLGPNGAGKTTTIKALTGQIRPSSGSATFQGKDLWEHFDELKSLFGYVADFDNHLEELSAYQNLLLFSMLYGLPVQRAMDALDTVELRNEKDQKVKNFSKGMKKKLTIAREIMHRPKLLYLDEPTANLDVHSTKVIRSLLKRLAREGTTVFCTTHNMEEAEELCHRIAIIDRGRIVGVDTPHQFKKKYADPVVRVILDGGQGERVELLRLDKKEDQDHLAEQVRSGHVVSLQSHAASFKEVFLKLTGREFH